MRTAPHIERNGGTFIPPSMAPEILRSLHLPTNAREHGSTRELFADISSLFARVTRQGESVKGYLLGFRIRPDPKRFSARRKYSSLRNHSRSRGANNTDLRWNSGPKGIKQIPHLRGGP